ncbi:hypothetical protein AWM79_23675 [Pseudomonas agarici]|uniref:Uncharacterized protein n=1 Tax=Pseudomonas agarici TaxID=46677 RepID=A0A0X1T8I1_PSEAA|nr:cytochrome c maturation protein CcmE [Pseudomonas agarici]AMB88109.1 hypothetical protein AWM79_23675 [Pseudomonas agarici]NWB93001.1 cytochrome c maturation protein CcmE [Pseudomonas agarici]NWC09268.1 cytochrome c maturation protein CcmE [Pseudomonas agarici]SEK29944.1 cytochrome c-type biogenesis protein CcmE [Pseudomonas agarici]
MSQLHKLRLIFFLSMLAGISTASTVVMSALRENISLFYTPTQIANGEVPENTRLRAGGAVEVGSPHRSTDAPDVSKALKKSGQSLQNTYNMPAK